MVWGQIWFFDVFFCFLIPQHIHFDLVRHDFYDDLGWSLGPSWAILVSLGIMYLIDRIYLKKLEKKEKEKEKEENDHL